AGVGEVKTARARISGNDAARGRLARVYPATCRDDRATKKAAAAAFFGTGVAGLLLEADARELVAELFDAAAEGVDALLRAGVERVRLARGFQLEERQLAAVVHLHGFLGLR